MVRRGSPKLSMIPKGSPKFGRMLSATSTRMKTVSPQSRLAKKTTSSPNGNQVKQRAIWNAQLKKSLVEILFEYKDSGCRGDNGWNTKGWNRMVKEFHARNKCVSFTKSQVQEKEGQLKRDYKMLKVARQQSGSSWNDKRCMVEGSPAMWQNLQITFPKIKKFSNNKATFPLYDALGGLYDGKF
uniref:Myb/SANT-like domain-containing protein n=1 Tax=Oryza punctata TaxID=4537 RepID=A0A0E0MF79_ORYPU